MPAKKKKTIIEETIPEETTSTAAQDFADAVCVVTKVYRLNGGGKSFCFQTNDPVDEVSIQAMYPTGGKFVVLEYNSLNQNIGTTHLEIEPKPNTTPNGNGAGGNDLYIRLILDELNHSRNMMVEMIKGLTNGGNKQATPLGELAQAMETVHTLTGKSNPTELILKGMELGMKAGGGSVDWKSQLIDSAKEMIPHVAPIFANRQNPPQGAQTQMIPASPAAMMKQGIEWLKPQIVSGMTVDLAVGWVIQNAQQPLYNALIATALKGDINTFIEIDPELANEPYKTWFTSAIELLKEEFTNAANEQREQSDDENDSNRGNGNRSNVAGDETVGPRQSAKITKVG